MASFIQADLKNRLLSRMSSRDFALIERDLVFVEMPRGYELITADQLIEYCWFIESGVASVVATSADGAETEVGIVGRDGMLDVAIVLGVERSPLRSFIQIAASGFRVPFRSRSIRSSRQARLSAISSIAMPTTTRFRSRRRLWRTRPSALRKDWPAGC